MLWIIITLTIVALLVWKFYLQPYKYWSSMGVPQGRPWPLLGDFWPTILRKKNILEWLEWVYYMHPESRYVGVYQFFQPILFLRDPELIKQLSVKDFDHFTDHTSFTISEEIDPLWGKNLFSLKGQKWRNMRYVMSGSFTSSKMRMMYGLIAEESEKFVNYFCRRNEDFIELEMKDAFTRYCTDVIASTSYGIKINSLEDKDNEFFRMGKVVANFNGAAFVFKFIAAQICPWILKLFKIGFIPKKEGEFFTGIIQENIRAREEQGIVRKDMINLLLEVKRGLNKPEETDVPDKGFAVVQELEPLVKPQKKQIQITNMDIASQAMVFFLGGFDSISSAMSFTSYELAINPDVQEKLRKEIKDKFEETEGKPTYEDILGMKYLDMVVSEALRLWPVAPSIDRLCVKPFILEPTSPEEPTITLNKGDIIWLPIYSIHHDAKYYPNPGKFIPERFSEENRSNIKPHTYLPFGIGPRACIGSRFALLETKTVLFHLLNKFEIVTTEKIRIPLLINKSGIAPQPEGGYPLALKRIREENNFAT